MRKRLGVIYGPTAIGKTSLGIKLAQKLRGEIVSADSRQIYQGMDIGTGKDLEKGAQFYPQPEISPLKEYQVGYYYFEGVRVWLLDIVSPDKSFSSYCWAELAAAVIENIWRRGKIPWVVGGSGFYLKTLLDGIDTAGVGPDWSLRRRLSSWSLAELQEELKRLSPGRWEKMNLSDRKNPRRLIRAIEVVKKGGKEKKKRFLPPVNLLAFFLTAPLEVIFERINQRVKKRLKEGLMTEIKKLLESFSWDDPGLNTLAYKEFKPYWEGKVTQEEAIATWRKDEQDYARRQLLWFKNDPRFVCLDVTAPDFDQEVNKLVKMWYSQKDNEEKKDRN